MDRLRPITASPRAKKIAYRISDQFLRFHYRFVEPARSQLRTNALATAYLRDTVLPQLDHHASQAWEDVCREYVLRTVPGVSAVGRWWGQVPTGKGARTEEREIDVVGIDAQGKPLVIGMCKWTSADGDFAELNLLGRLAPHIDGYDGTAQRFIFPRNGFSARLRSFAGSDPNLTLVSPSDVYS